MSKNSQKTGSKSSRTKSKAARAAKESNKTSEGKRGRKAAAAAESAGALGTALADPRLPPVGTIIQKRDRYGAVRCECTVEEGGIRYKDTLYRSLSAAAMAAAKDLRLTNKTQNGFTFWALSKPAGRGADPVTAIQQAAAIFARKAEAAISGRVTDANRSAVDEALHEHAEALEALRGSVAS